jgi:signal-transduction protein with cAMP-binding, CBS, and nucleotidyltransferase domain
MHSLREVLSAREMFHVESHQSVADVVRRMANLKVGAILVLERGELKGIFSERDLMMRVVVAGLDVDSTRVGEVMTTDLATIQESARMDEAMEMMRLYKCRHLPVLRGSQVVGMVSMRDLMNVELEEKTEEIAYMRNYIAGAS